MFLNNISDSDEDKKCAPKICLDTLGLSQEIDKNSTKVITKNKNYKKNLGVGGASYDACDIDLNTFTFEKNIFNQEKKQSYDSIGEGVGEFKLLEIPQGASQDILDPLILSNQVSQSQQCQRDAIETSNNWVLEEIQKQQQYLEQLEKLEQIEKQEQEECQIEICDFLEAAISDLIPMPPVCPYSVNITQINLPDQLLSFLINPIPTEGMFQCKIVRDKSGLNRFMPKYKMYWCHNNQFLLAAKKSLNKNKFIITQDSEFKHKDQGQILGKVEQSKQSKADYYLFDSGSKKKESNSIKKMRVQLGSVDQEGWLQFQEKVKKKLSNLLVVNLKLQIHNNKLYTLDFFGRVKKASVKNFQLVLKGEERDLIYVQFGKIDKDQFHLDFMSPLSPLVAMQLALCNFNFKGKA
ncbi:unnamed protein product (macronuclear) [Paramecium tetraurelia]|uniref:Tubby C-terminal domain-containing protein n=1 Tax=Paramecium tetraurelia TaxID=5888 RepID=A0CJ98_PARTE|nr:uncharacterized protein GSPATT00000575001 [Paramecium tetraurelia]CAK70865.1 unnamed protein product [Paramecium tetraurelia]|eukprot:XP_001438262.1 hypothetical protein (macronuclear) [Paramecium tetraurelia strain d4-2]